MANKLELKLYDGNDLIEDSQLRSVLLFYQFSSKHEGEEFMMQRLVLSIIIQENGNCSLDDIQRALAAKSITLSAKEVNKYLTALISDKLIFPTSDGNYKAISNEEKGEEFFRQLNIDTDHLIDGIYRRYEKLCVKPEPSPAHIKSIIRKALSVYYKIAGLTFFRLQKGRENIKEAIGETFKHTIEASSAKRLITAIGETIEKPTDSERACMVKWARAYVVTQVLRLDPMLKNFRQDRLRKKSFVIDTDVLLRTITTHTAQSDEYRRNIEYLRKLGCKLFVPEDVIKEVKGCAEEALGIAGQLSLQQLIELKDTLNQGPKANVFIEDYLNMVSSDDDNKDLPFKVYLGNIYRYQDSSVLRRRIASVIGDKNVNLTLPKYELDEETQARLSEKILQITSSTQKGSTRSEKFNEKVSMSDAQLYLTIQKCNMEGGELASGDGILSYKYYLLSQSHKTIDSAKSLSIYKEDIICNPKSLTAVLSQLGDIQMNDSEIINLFENPFLVYTAEEIWNKIEPILKKGGFIYHADTNQLKSLVEVDFDKALRTEDPEERIAHYKQFTDMGFKFSEDLARLAIQNQSLKKENEEFRKENIKSKEIIEKLSKERKKDRHLARLGKSRGNNKTARRRKK